MCVVILEAGAALLAFPVARLPRNESRPFFLAFLAAWSLLLQPLAAAAAGAAAGQALF